MARGGRPKAKDTEALSAHVALRLTEAERLDLIERAAAAGYASLSQYARVALLQRGTPARRHASTTGVFSADDRRALINIGNNLNQLVRLRHSGRDHVAGDELAEALTALHDVLDRYLPA